LHGTRSSDPQLYDCRLTVGDKIARFQIALQPTYTYVTVDKMMLPVLDGDFVAVARSQNSVLLKRLKVALGATHLPRSSKKIRRLPFTAVVLGENQSRSNDDAYADDPPGNWISIKMFLPAGGDRAELYLDINPVEGVGEFSMKDSQYGDYLLAAFAKVL
jgi:hypothetical protein